VRRPAEIADAAAIGQRHGDRWLQTALTPTRFEDVRGASAERITLEGAVDLASRPRHAPTIFASPPTR
jgi:hypothetical protein